MNPYPKPGDGDDSILSKGKYKLMNFKQSIKKLLVDEMKDW